MIRVVILPQSTIARPTAVEVEILIAQELALRAGTGTAQERVLLTALDFTPQR